MKCCFLDDRQDFFSLLAEKLGKEFAMLPAQADDRNELAGCDVIVFGLPPSGGTTFASALANLQTIVRHPGVAPVVVFVPTPDRQAMRESINAGAYDCFVESGSMDELRIVLRRAAQFREMNREIERLRSSTPSLGDFSALLGADAKMRAVFLLARKVAATDANVLIAGESGTGKELLSRAIHSASPRAQEPFVAVACSSIPETLIESELFGHEKGAFTGATSTRRGRFEAAGRGTIFLDEIGDLSPAMQVKLLRVLQERTFERLGSNKPLPMEARVICATHRNLKELVQTGGFRLDLYYRLNTVELELPALCERRDDIRLLANAFLQMYTERHKRPALRFSAPSLFVLEEYEWPGNVRELQNVIERAVVVCDGPEIRVEHLPSQFAGPEGEQPAASFEDEVRNFKRRLIQRTLMEYKNNKLQAARSLKIARSSLHRLIDDLDIPPTVQ
ncbi:MAG: sigma-54 dependent transcriptional regulator [Acidobacteria bacterium]|nr:sigma-54 dependent transcriptional regulator [Acidobacteriota bacterium]